MNCAAASRQINRPEGPQVCHAVVQQRFPCKAHRFAAVEFLSENILGAYQPEMAIILVLLKEETLLFDPVRFHQRHVMADLWNTHLTHRKRVYHQIEGFFDSVGLIIRNEAQSETKSESVNNRSISDRMGKTF